MTPGQAADTLTSAYDGNQMPLVPSSRTVAVAATAAAVVCLAGCGFFGAGGRLGEPGLGGNYPVANQTTAEVHLEKRFQPPGTRLKPFDPLTDNTATIGAGGTVYLTGVNLTPNDCIDYTLIAYADGKEIARKPAPMCADAHGHAGWTITRSGNAATPAAAASGAAR